MLILRTFIYNYSFEVVVNVQKIKYKKEDYLKRPVALSLYECKTLTNVVKCSGSKLRLAFSPRESMECNVCNRPRRSWNKCSLFMPKRDCNTWDCTICPDLTASKSTRIIRQMLSFAGFVRGSIRNHYSRRSS